MLVHAYTSCKLPSFMESVHLYGNQGKSSTVMFLIPAFLGWPLALTDGGRD